MVHGIKFSSDVLASPLLDKSDVGDCPSIDNAFKPMKSLDHVSIFEKKVFSSFNGREHKRSMKILAPASDEDTVRILHAASNCDPLLSDMNVND